MFSFSQLLRQGLVQIIPEKPNMGKEIALALPGPRREQGGAIIGEGWVITPAQGHLFQRPEPEGFMDDGYVVVDGKKKRKRWNWGDLPLTPGHGKYANKPWRKVIDPKSKHRLDVIFEWSKKAATIIHAGDPDRAGQRIGDDILIWLKWKKPVPRLWLDSLDVPTVKKALENMKPNEEYHLLGVMEEERDKADWVLGYTFTRAHSLQFWEAGGDGVMNVGRCKAPVLELLRQNHEARASFRPKDYFVPWIRVQHEMGEFKAYWQAPEGFPGLDPEGRLVDPEIGQALMQALRAGKFRLAEYKEERKEQQPPLLYNLGKLQADANRIYGLSSDVSLEAGQKLYDERKAMSYVRSECQYGKELQRDAGQELLSGAGGFPGLDQILPKADFGLKSPTWNDAKVGAHYGIQITPGFKDVNWAECSSAEKCIANLVVRRHLMQFLPPRKYVTQRAMVEVELPAIGAWPAGKHLFKANGLVETDPGWKIAKPTARKAAEEDAEIAKADAVGADEEEEGTGNRLPRMQAGDPIRVAGGNIDKRVTEPPLPFTEGSLMEAMMQIHKYVQDPEKKKKLRETDGIGTAATRTNVIKELIGAGLIIRVKKKLLDLSPAGLTLVNAIHPDIRDPGMTAIWESGLSRIEEGKVDASRFHFAVVQFVEAKIEEVRSKGMTVREGAVKQKGPAKVLPGDGDPCPACGTGVLRTVELHAGPHKGKVFLGCSRHAEGCKGPLSAPKPPPEALPGDGDQCSTCGQGVMRTRRVQAGDNAGKRFLSCDAFKANGCKNAIYPPSEWPPRPQGSGGGYKGGGKKPGGTRKGGQRGGTRGSGYAASGA